MAWKNGATIPFVTQNTKDRTNLVGVKVAWVRGDGSASPVRVPKKPSTWGRSGMPVFFHGDGGMALGDNWGWPDRLGYRSYWYLRPWCPHLNILSHASPISDMSTP
eukprot:Gb_24982 [translate_table: standard]